MLFKRDIYNRMLKWKRGRQSDTVKQSLEVSGARQVGKTTALNEFATNNYTQVVSIDLGEAYHQRIVNEWANMPITDELMDINNRIGILLKRFQPEFVDSQDTVIIVDEIQESHHVYNLIRPITRKMRAHLIVTGSYLGKVANDKDFFLPAGDLQYLRMDSLSFEEFLGVYGWRDIYDTIDLYGGSEKEWYDGLAQMFKLYCVIGGYPEVIKAYKQGGDIKEVTERIDWLMTVFTKESARYFPDVADKTLYARIMRAVASMLVNEKKGLPDIDKTLAENLIKHLVLRKDEEQNIRITKNSIYKATYWMWQSSLLDMCGKCLDCNPLQLVDNNRYYFTDMGTAYRHLDPVANTDVRDGMLAENFAYLQLRDIIPEQRLTPEYPCFGEYNGGEMDFIIANRHGGTKYAVEVKSGRSGSKTADLLLQKNIVDYVVYAKGDTYGGKADRKLTIPLYLLKRFVFEDYTGRAKVELPKPPTPPSALHFNAE